MPSLGLVFFYGCGGLNVTVGSASSPNDLRPTSTVVAQGQFAGQNGKTVAGTALIFSPGNSTYIARLEGVSIPADSGLVVQVYADPGGKVASFTLRAATGSQNYTFTSTTTGLTFNNVYIFSIPTNINYGVAQLF
jgi:hypothetical protein